MCFSLDRFNINADNGCMNQIRFRVLKFFIRKPSNNQIEHFDLFRQLAHEDKKCVIVATHSKELAANSDILFSIQHGRLIQSESMHNKEISS